jgi:dTDP-4-dehydrorhamnose reductase
LSATRVFVTGAAGRLGAAIVSAFQDRQVTAHTRATLDIADADAVSRAVAAARPDVIINCAAFNDVDGAESAPIAALAVNAFAPRNLAKAARDSGAVLVHYGTDFVFDGRASQPYDEMATPSPQSTYAASKLLGEWFALDAPRAYVLVWKAYLAPRTDGLGEWVPWTTSSRASRPVVTCGYLLIASCRRVMCPTSRPQPGISS